MEFNESVLAIKDNRTGKLKYVIGLLEFEQYLEQIKGRKFGIEKLAYDLTSTIINLEDQEQIQDPGRQQSIEQDLEQMSNNPPTPEIQKRAAVAQEDYDPEEDDPFEQQAASQQHTHEAPMKSKEKPFMPPLPDQLQPKKQMQRPQIPRPQVQQPIPQDAPPRPQMQNQGRRKKQQEPDNNEELDYEGDEKNIFDEDGF